MSNSYAAHISPQGRTFVDAKGRSFFWLGDTAWSLLTHYTPEQAETYLRRRAAQGFTVIQVALTWFQGAGGVLDPARIAANYRSDLPWQDGDPAQPSPAYFEQVDALLALAGELGLTLALLPVWGSMVTDQHFVHIGNAGSYGRWLGERYRRAPNLVWVNGGDCLPHGSESVFDALGAGLRAGDEGRHLMTFHPCHLHSSSQYWNDRPWYDFHLIQSWTDWHKVYEAVRADLTVSPTRPVVLGEGAYEDGPEYPRGPITPLVARRQAWWAALAGGYYTYGHNLLWRGGPGLGSSIGRSRRRPDGHLAPDRRRPAGVGCTSARPVDP